MEANTPTDAEAFLSFLTYEIQNGGADKSPEELLQSWRATYADTIEDIRQGVRDSDAGRFRPFDEVDAEIRIKFGFPSKPA
jgi:hypothetical protein